MSWIWAKPEAELKEQQLCQPVVISRAEQEDEDTERLG
jgi:hypothetical protein